MKPEKKEKQISIKVFEMWIGKAVQWNEYYVGAQTVETRVIYKNQFRWSLRAAMNAYPMN